MGVKEVRDDFRVEVYPRRAGDFGFCKISGVYRSEQEEESMCHEIAQDVRRHVDNLGEVIVQWESNLVCEFCGSDWTEPKDSPHNGGCCGEDSEVMERVDKALEK